MDARESKALKEVLTDPSEHDRMAGRTRRAALRLLGSLLEVFCALVEFLCALGSAVIVRLTIALILREQGGAVFGSEAKALAVGKILSGGFFSPIFGYRLALLILGAQKPPHQKERSGVFGRVLSIAYRDYRESPDVAALYGQRPRTIRVSLSVCSRVQEDRGERRPVWMVSHYVRHPQKEARFRPISRGEHPSARWRLSPTSPSRRRGSPRDVGPVRRKEEGRCITRPADSRNRTGARRREDDGSLARLRVELLTDLRPPALSRALRHYHRDRPLLEANRAHTASGPENSREKSGLPHGSALRSAAPKRGEAAALHQRRASGNRSLPPRKEGRRTTTMTLDAYIDYGVLGADPETDLKDFVIYRVDARDGWKPELCAESSLEQEAVNCAHLMTTSEPFPQEEVYYEVRLSRTGELLATTEHAESPLGELADAVPRRPTLWCAL